MRYGDALVAERRTARGLAALRRFLSAFAAGRLEEAGTLAAERFSWFGRAIGAESWDSTRAITSKLSFRATRVVPEEIVSTVSMPELFDGALADGDAVYLADVTRDGKEVTLGAVMAEIDGHERILRVFDPTPLRDALRKLQRAEPVS